MDPRVREAVRLLSKDLRRPPGLAEVARAVNLSPSRLAHLFKRATGLPPARYLKRLRMERARTLFENTFLSVKQVMHKVGVSDESHFVRDFRAAYGLPPIKYRADHLDRLAGETRGTGAGKVIAVSANK